MSGQFKKAISLYSLTMIAIGSSIGSGIFRALYSRGIYIGINRYYFRSKREYKSQ